MYIPMFIWGVLVGIVLVFIVGYIIYKVKGWDKEENDIVKLKGIINKSRAKLDSMFANGNEKTVLDDLLELDKILNVEENLDQGPKQKTKKELKKQLRDMFKETEEK